MSGIWARATPPEPTRRYWIYSIPELSPKIEASTIMNSVLKGIYLDPSIYHF
ncbi:hypothetical protein Peur_054829 [Populus x canadensis]